MKQFAQVICIMVLFVGLVFSGNRRIAKSEISMERQKKVEPDYRHGQGATRDACAHSYPRITCDVQTNDCPNSGICVDWDGDSNTHLGSCMDPETGAWMPNESAVVTVIDSSSNGFGMVATVTRPFDVNSSGDMLVVYRQYAGENTTHGQLGAGYGDEQSDGSIEWDTQYNINANGNPPWGGGGVGGGGTSQARYPSAIAAEDYPYAVWNEYTGNVVGWPSECSLYGGRPYFTYDDFNWFGGSWWYPWELDPLYDCGKDLWQGSVAYAKDADGLDHVSVVYDDWTRTGSYLFTSEAVDEGYIVLGTENLIVNPQNLGTDNYSSSAILSMNDKGLALLGLDGIFNGVDMDATGDCGAGACNAPASNLTCNKVPMFKLSKDYGQSWQRTAGNAASYDYYYVGDEVFDDIFSNWPSVDVDACTGESYDICGYWSWYEFDMRVDNVGNPHIVISLIAESDQYIHFFEGYTGFYHLTIEAYDESLISADNPFGWTGNLDNPGLPNTPTGWNWSYIPLPANDSFQEYRPDGGTYLFGAMCQISLSRDNPDIVYMVANIAEKGDMAYEFDQNQDGNEDDPCLAWNFPQEVYPNWSEDIWVAKSEDNGSTWTGLENVTQTPRDSSHPGANNCAPEEQYVHTAHWSDNDRVYYQYNQPNWEFNEIGDPTGPDHMNRVFLGYSWVEAGGVGGCQDPSSCNFNPSASFDDGSCASATLGTQPCTSGGTDPNTGLPFEAGDFGCDCNNDCYTYTDKPLQQLDCADVCGGFSVQLCGAAGGLGDCVNTDTDNDGDVDSSDNPVVCTWSSVSDCLNDPNANPSCSICTSFDQVNSWTDCDDQRCGANHMAVQGCAEGSPFYTNNCTGGRCETCSDASLVSGTDCSIIDPATGIAINDCTALCNAGAGQWDIETTNDCEDAQPGCTDVTTDKAACDAINGLWVPYVDDFSTNDEVEQGDEGNPNECYCLADDSESACEVNCPQNGDISGDGNFNVLDIVGLANCILAGNCEEHPNGCAADVNGDGSYNVLDIVSLANCILGNNCAGRMDDATSSRLIKQNNMVILKSDGYIGGVQMTISHGDDFSIDMNEEQALFADYLTNGNKTTLLVVNPETENIFSYVGDFKIEEIIVANSHAEVAVDLAIASEFSLSAAYPNPFNPITTMKLTMPVSGDVKVEVYNLLGQVVATLASGYMDAKTYDLSWDAQAEASGMYFVKAQTGEFTKTQKIMLVK